MKKTLLVLIAVAILLYLIVFSGLVNDQFLFIHDEYLVFSREAASNSFYIRSPNDFGYSTFSTTVVTFLDRVVYFSLYTLGLSLTDVTKVNYLFKFLLAVILPYIGFSKILEKNGNKSQLGLFVLVLVYAFGSYPLVYWNSNGFSMSLLVFYALAPWSFYYVLLMSERLLGIKELISLAVITCFMSFGFYLFLVYVVFCLVYVSFNLKLKIFIVNLVKVFTLYAPFISTFWLIVYDMYFTSVQNVNFSGGETYNQLYGGFLYPMFMWFSWGIYNIWSPRSIFVFYNYSQSFISVLPVIMTYVLVAYFGYKYKFGKFVISLLGVFLVMLFFIKGPQEPFGQLYLYLVNNVSMFRVFRSPDSKFGFGVFFSVILLLTYLVSQTSRFTRKENLIVFLCLGLFCITQVYIVFSGKGIIGENTETSADRVLQVSTEYKNMADFLNNSSYGYLISEPQSDFGYFKLSNSERHFGQDILPKLISQPIIYTDEHSSISKDAYMRFRDALNSQDVDKLSSFPVRYFLIRRDNLQKKPDITTVEFIDSHMVKVFENSLFELYINPNATAQVAGEGISDFNRINPVTFKGVVSESTKQLILYENYSPGWQLRVGDTKVPASRLSGDFGNKWNVDVWGRTDVTLYYAPQDLFKTGLIISGIYMMVLLTWLGYLHFSRR